MNLKQIVLNQTNLEAEKIEFPNLNIEAELERWFFLQAKQDTKFKFISYSATHKHFLRYLEESAKRVAAAPGLKSFTLPGQVEYTELNIHTKYGLSENNYKIFRKCFSAFIFKVKSNVDFTGFLSVLQALIKEYGLNLVKDALAEINKLDEFSLPEYVIPNEKHLKEFIVSIIKIIIKIENESTN